MKDGEMKMGSRMRGNTEILQSLVVNERGCGSARLSFRRELPF